MVAVDVLRCRMEWCLVEAPVVRLVLIGKWMPDISLSDNVGILICIRTPLGLGTCCRTRLAVLIVFERLSCRSAEEKL